MPLSGLREMSRVRGPECVLLSARIDARGLVLSSEADIKGSKHGDVDAQPSQHQLYGTEHECCQRGASQVAD